MLKTGLSVWLIPQTLFLSPNSIMEGYPKAIGEFFRRCMGGKVMAQERIDSEEKRICPTDMAQSEAKAQRKEKKKCPDIKGTSKQVDDISSPKQITLAENRERKKLHLCRAETVFCTNKITVKCVRKQAQKMLNPRTVGVVDSPNPIFIPKPIMEGYPKAIGELFRRCMGKKKKKRENGTGSNRDRKRKEYVPLTCPEVRQKHREKKRKMSGHQKGQRMK
ncbi:hypothetical protein CEXT_642411 [Caerostris extrusa]|uniref:Uncharacterized protein n=1 Tax=Caerostris extrusa TaxID=172846 RepID=A0AAV4V7P7_CAEEX|nr:hypothetical protein CEXT_642411 [Caerostris extrusa]